MGCWYKTVETLSQLKIHIKRLFWITSLNVSERLISVIPVATSLNSGVRDMSKGMDSKKSAKKKPAKTADEKRADKKSKKADAGLFGH